MTIRLGWIVAAASTIFIAGATGQDAAPLPRDISALLEPIRESRRLPALAALVVEGDRIVSQGVVGVRRQGSAEAATIDDQWHIGSCTKSMTATLVAILVDRGDLAWSATVGDSFRGAAPAMDPGWNGVTIEHLLAHRGGVPANLDADGLWGRLWSFDGPPREARVLLVNGVIAKPPESAPGARFVYSNAGYAIAGAMAERAADRSYEDLMRELLFAPLGMTSAGFGAPGSPERIDQPRGHRPSPDGPVPVEPGPGSDNPPAIAPAGTVHCSLPDWAKYISWHLRSARGELPADAPLRIAPETLARLHAPFGEGAKSDEGYALGWGVTRRDWGGRVLTHAGSNTMWFAVVWMAPEQNFAALVATNVGGEGASRGADEAVWAVIQDYLHRRDLPE